MLLPGTFGDCVHVVMARRLSASLPPRPVEGAPFRGHYKWQMIEVKPESAPGGFAALHIRAGRTAPAQTCS